jgi:hypothetical protein
MRGSAEVSSGGSDEMERLKRAFAQDAAAREVLASDGDPAHVLASLSSLAGEAGAAVSGYLDLAGNRLIDGFDIAEPSALEVPDALLRAIRIAASGETQATSDVDARIAEVRAQVPAAHQANRQGIKIRRDRERLLLVCYGNCLILCEPNFTHR